MPYKKILPKDLYKELLKDFLNNNSSPIKNSLRSKNKDDKEIHMNINSKIISLPYIEIVTKWINRLKITDSRVMDERCAINNSPYYGLSFGNGDLCLYQTLRELRIHCKKTNCEKQIRENNNLQKFCTELFSKQPGKIFNSPDFTSISEKILTSLIQNDLQISEVQIWEHVLKWAIAQNPGLSLDPSSYSKDDFNVLKNTLQRRILLIKFIKFTSKEFLIKVCPYKKVILRNCIKV
ncbi:BTB/POZ protein [Rhizophagus irregularis DAOM 181602=DAOM 197198]|nr:BTB/POZ protein [Rhizophagus irregularis DAOM 181602=DAOM 197198]